MGFNCGIVGLPNVGKSTLFNALTASANADAQNYPFCTIEPNVGIVMVPDKTLLTLAELANSAKIIPTTMEFVDIAGLVKGASSGEGLGNKFLGHIQSVDAILHVVRCFENNDIIHVNNEINPLADIETIETELMLADLESIEKQILNLTKKARGNDKDAIKALSIAEKIQGALSAGKMAKSVMPESLEDRKIFNSFCMLTSKPVMYVCNVDEASAVNGNKYSDMVVQKMKGTDSRVVIISSKIEQEIACLESEDEKKEFLESIGLSETGLGQVIRQGYAMLNLITFYTVGPKEAHAWTIVNGATAPNAAGKIHTDFEKGFIRAEIISADDFIKYGGELKVKEAGKMRTVGKDYIMNSGDICHFLFNV